jgi:xanthine dehydrogenase accessory factor
MRDFLERVAALRRHRERFATATVVGRRAPVSAHLGDRAIIYADGRLEGFVGRARHARLVSITPDATAGGGSDPEHVVVPMTCVSEGAVDVYIEPDLRPRRLVVVGTSPVADALTRTALAIDYEVVRVVDTAEQRDLEPSSAVQGFTVAPLESLDDVLKESAGEAAAVVASQGHYDEQALEAILRSGAAYVGLVASRTRGNTVRTLLTESGVTGLEAVRIPAGLDLGARTAP